MTYANGSYTGNFVNCKKQGQGTYTWASGKIYTGNWSNDNMNGHGKMTFADGTTKTGLWKNDNFVRQPQD